MFLLLSKARGNKVCSAFCRGDVLCVAGNTGAPFSTTCWDPPCPNCAWLGETSGGVSTRRRNRRTENVGEGGLGGGVGRSEGFVPCPSEWGEQTYQQTHWSAEDGLGTITDWLDKRTGVIKAMGKYTFMGKILVSKTKR